MSEPILPDDDEKKINEPILSDSAKVTLASNIRFPITAIVLAAGLSRRMGKQNKLLLPIGKQKLIAKTVDVVLASQVEETLVVLGHEAIKLQRVLRGKNITLLKNSLYQLGMTTSIQRGVQAASKNTKAYIVVLGDLAQIEASTRNVLIEAFNVASQNEQTPRVIPTCEGKRGNPVIFSSHFKEVILQHQDMNGCKGIVQANSQHVVTVEMPNNQVLKDIDTLEDYKEWKLTVVEEEKKREELQEVDISEEKNEVKEGIIEEEKATATEELEDSVLSSESNLEGE